MKMNRTQNAVRNIITGSVLKLYQILVPFAMRTIMIYVLGVEYLGLNSLFTSVLQVLNLAELGVGSAMTFAMYKPIVENDKKSINALMNLYKTYYRVIGGIVLLGGCAVIPFLPKLIKDDIPPDMNLYVLYFMNLFATVLSYWLFAYRNSILQAHQRLDVVNKVTLITETIKYVLQISTLFIFKNYYIYVLILLFTQMLTNVMTAYMSKKHFPDYKPEGKIDPEIKQGIDKKIKDLFTAKLGGVIVNSADTIVISSFLGLAMVGIYQNYYFVISAVMGFITIIFNSCIAGIGNSLIVESKEKNYTDLKKLTFIIVFITAVCSACFISMFQPFITAWVGKKLLLPFPVVCCLVLYFIVYEFNALFNVFKDAAGMWHEDRFRPLVTACSNLTMNLLTVKFLGLYGVVLSTVVAFLFIGIPWILNNIFKTIFDRKDFKEYVFLVLGYFFEVIAIAALTYLPCYYIPLKGIPAVIVRLVVCIIVAPSLFFAVNFRKIEMLYLIEMINKFSKSKFLKIGFVKNFYDKRSAELKQN